MTADALIDDAGRAHPPAGADARILSLVPSLTELLFDMDLAGQLVGRTAFCVHPKPAVDAVPSVGGTKRISLDKVRGLGATHALVNVDETPKQMADALSDMGLQVVVTHPIEVTDNIRLFRLIGGLFDRVEAAEGLCRALEAEIAAFPPDLPDRRVLYLIWQDPWMTVSRDTYIARVLTLANWRTVGHDDGVRYPEIALTDERLATVDEVLFSTEPFAFDASHVQAFRATFPAHAAKARLIDAEMVSWYGSRAVPGLRYLREFADGASS